MDVCVERGTSPFPPHHRGTSQVTRLTHAAPTLSSPRRDGVQTPDVIHHAGLDEGSAGGGARPDQAAGQGARQENRQRAAHGANACRGYAQGHPRVVYAVYVDLVVPGGNLGVEA